MSRTIRSIMDDSLAASYDPSGQYRASLKTLLAVMGGELDNISPANPVIYAIENQCALISAFTESMQAETRRLLQVHAVDPEDLYPHMADIHFTHIFNLPSSGKFMLVLNKNEIMNKLVPVPGTQSKKLTIPRDTYFTIADHVFGIHYPIDIIEQMHGGIRVSYDTTKTTDLHVLQTNILEHRFMMKDDIEHLVIDIPVHQFHLISKTPVVTRGTTFRHVVALSDPYYACRVYRTLADGKVEEIAISYSEEFYDPMKPTAVVKLIDGNVEVTIPQIFITREEIVGEVRIDVYTTKGPLDVSYDSYPVGAIVPRFRDLDKRASTTYSLANMKLSTYTVLPDGPVMGGALAMSPEDLRAAVIADAIGNPNEPITPAQIQNYLSRKGYDIIKNIDLTTDRVFLATRDMPLPKDPALLTPANGSIETMNAAFKDLVGRKCVVDNGETITITPEAIYELTDGSVRMLSDQELETMNQMRKDLLAGMVTAGSFLYSPFYYVLDKRNFQFRLSPYYLSEPKVMSQNFYVDNPTTQMQVNARGYELEKTDDGYRLSIGTKSNDYYQSLNNSQVHALIGFKSPTEDSYCWLKHDTVLTNSKTKERVFQFNLNSRLAIDEHDRIDFRNFKMFDLTNKTMFADLSQEFVVIFGTTAQMGSLFESSVIDTILPRFNYLEEGYIGITQERWMLNFGQALNNLWARARSVASSLEYETHPIDILERYEEDVFKKDPATGSELFMVDGKPTQIKLHSKGDPRLDADGNEQIRFPKGSLVYDGNGFPVVKSGRHLKHRFELFLVEAVYKFSNDPIAISYRNQIARTIAHWVTNDLSTIEKVTLDKTRAYFYPKTVYGTIDVMVSDGIVQQVPAAQRFEVSITIPPEVVKDMEIQAQLKRQTIITFSRYLDNRMLANSDIVRLLRKAYGSDATDVQVSYFGADANFPVMQLVNGTHRCGIRKRLVARDDDKLIVEEDITIVFKSIKGTGQANS